MPNYQESLTRLFAHPDIPSMGEIANAPWMRNLHLVGQPGATKDITQLLTIEHDGVAVVPDNRDWPRLVAHVTIGSQRERLAIPALEYPIPFTMEKLSKSIFRKDPSRILVAVRYGEQGMYFFHFNQKAIKLNQLLYVETTRLDDEYENPILGRDRYKPFDVDLRDRLTAKGFIRASNEPFSLIISTVRR